jgi:uncharacterized protein (UPF0276 family)
MLIWMRERYDISFHGVGLSLGGEQRPDKKYLGKLSSLIHTIHPFLVSDHLCWTGDPYNQTHNLLPLIYDDFTLNRVVSHIQEVQEILKRPIGLENLSAYFQHQQSTYHEWEFIVHCAQKTGCFLLLDINNVYVNSKNHQFCPYRYLDAIPAHLIGEVHLAGFTDMGSFLFDTHSHPVHPDVWDLFRYKSKDLVGIPVLVEWDDQIPDFPVLEKEATMARDILQHTLYPSTSYVEQASSIF